MEIPITFLSDDKGYFDRECPNENCAFVFKINMDDWQEKISDEEVHCPKCGHIDTSDKWWTQKQLADIEKAMANWAVSHIQDELDKIFKSLERNTRGNKYVKITYNPGERITFTNNSLGQSEEWEQDIQCPKCGTRYSVIGTAYFCPCCGLSVIEDIFEESLDIKNKMIDSIDEMKAFFEKQYGLDKAVSMCQSMLEGCLGDIVSIFQKFAVEKFKALSTRSVKVNDFQIVEKGSRLFEEVPSKGYDKWLNEVELSTLKLMFQRRHIIEHNGGIVDKIYLEKSKDSNYKIGQRLVVHKAELYELIRIIKTLGNGLNQLTI